MGVKAVIRAVQQSKTCLEEVDVSKEWHVAVKNRAVNFVQVVQELTSICVQLSSKVTTLNRKDIHPKCNVK